MPQSLQLYTFSSTYGSSSYNTSTYNSSSSNTQSATGTSTSTQTATSAGTGTTPAAGKLANTGFDAALAAAIAFTLICSALTVKFWHKSKPSA